MRAMPLLFAPRGKESYGATIFHGDEIARLLTPATLRISPHPHKGKWYGVISPAGQPPVVAEQSLHAVRVTNAIKPCCPDGLSVRARSDGHIEVLSRVPLDQDGVQQELLGILRAAVLWNIQEIAVDGDLNPA